MSDHTPYQLEIEFPTVKLCECGCGLPAPIATKTITKRGQVKGQPIRFIFHHSPRRPISERFWEKVDKRGPDDCWEWKGGKVPFGHGQLRAGAERANKMLLAHRVSWMLHNGDIPDGVRVLHRCDNPPCVNPAHLFLGTDADNTWDMIAKGRSAFFGAKGEANHTSKLTEQQVHEIRRRAALGETAAALAREFGMERTVIRALVHRKTWKHI